MDFDGDGQLDILTGSIAGKVYLYRRKTDGTFARPEELSREVWHLAGSGVSAIYAGKTSAVAMADWFGSGKLDLFVGNGEGEVYLFRNQGTRQKPLFHRGERLKAAAKPIMADGGNAGPCVADWNGDGKLDLILGCGSGRVVWYSNVGTMQDPGLAEGVTLVEAADVEPRRSLDEFNYPKRSAQNAKVCVADWNGDGLLDLIVGDFSGARVGGRYRAHGWLWVYLRKGPQADQAKPE